MWIYFEIYIHNNKRIRIGQAFLIIFSSRCTLTRAFFWIRRKLQFIPWGYILHIDRCLCEGLKAERVRWSASKGIRKRGSEYDDWIQNIRKMPESLIWRNQIGNHGFIVGRGNVRLCIIGSVLDTQPTLSYHMKMMKDCGLVDSRKDGIWVKYSVNHEKLDELKDFFQNMAKQNTTV